ncbi:polyphosphate kinase 1 [Agaribacter marinus]|uniref:Polyphosphate kinase n=1 Tax=Agaribacter marinus TaxID=1431249 RepID=A0AA37WHH0_9ALTE|nr:polyphosphate kinase 1 [Agaribacter marinus]GLR71086.1 polyphosphate kinase [Agaribacter marinus]
MSSLYFPKELSWLSFNERVLQEAADPNTPVVERIRFLGIYSNNLDEFYRVRVADVKRMIAICQSDGEMTLVEEYTNLLREIQRKVKKLSRKFDQLHKQVTKDLRRYNIHILHYQQLTEAQVKWAEKYFREKILMHVAPILLDNKVQLLQRLNDSSVYLHVALYRPGKNPKYAVVEIPTNAMSRFVVLPPDGSRVKKQIILIDDIIKLCVEEIFRGFVRFDTAKAFSFKITRDAEYSINDEIDESYVEKMSESMKQRLIAEPVRIIHDQGVPEEMIDDLRKRLKISTIDTIQSAGHYRNFKDFIGFPNPGRAYLEHTKLPVIRSKAFGQHNTVFDAITNGDILLYYPYHDFTHFTEFVRQAAFDPQVRHIRLNIYRVASHSRIISSLVDAVDNGKKVTVVVELRARFDEENNIAWSKRMTDAGIKVVLGNPNVKIHSKLCIVTREERGKVKHYAHFGTGNFNEKTAKIYTDLSLFTCDDMLATEAVQVFEMIQNPYKKVRFNQLQVSPVNARSKIQSLIRQEIQRCTEGHFAQITLKINNLVDNELIDDLYRASQSGVKVRAIIRGMCSLIPGVAGLSENIEIISVVDRFLEHPRIMVFENGGDPKYFISSADWMTRNMDYRIEVGCPVKSPEARELIDALLDFQFKDTLKSRVIDEHQVNEYVKRGNRKKLRSQIQIHQYLTEREES